MPGSAPRHKIDAVPPKKILETTKHFIREHCPAVDLSVSLICW